MKTRILFAASIFIGSLALASCSMSGTGTPEDRAYEPVLLSRTSDPRESRPTLRVLSPPRQMAVWIHPHRDRDRGIWVDGYWIYILLGDGWTFEGDKSWEEQEIVPDEEATAKEIERALLIDAPSDVSVPYRTREDR